jgi:predicted transcriptional regulator
MGMTARELMASPVVHTTPEASMAEAARTMLQRALKHLPVVSEGRVVGLLSRSDLLEPFERSDAQLRGEVAARLVAFLPEGAVAPGVEVVDGVVVVAADGLNPREVTELEVHLAELPGVAGVRMSGRRR